MRHDPARTSCRICQLPAGTRNVALTPQTVPMTDDGLCSYCDFARQSRFDLFDTRRCRQLFEQRLQRIRGRYPYDALVGLSGGKDGAYVLHRLVRDYGLKVLAFTFDNGFLSDEATRKVSELTDLYQVEHFFYRPVYLLPLYRAIVKAAGVPCHACAMGGYYRALGLLIERRIPLFVHGRSPYQILRNLDGKAFDNDPFFSLVRSNLEEYAPEALRVDYRRIDEGVRKALDQLPLTDTERRAIAAEFFDPLRLIEPDFVPESFAYFLTETYDEASIRSVLREEAGYEAPTSHGDCLIHHVANYLSARQYTASIQVMETAARVRHGELPISAVQTLLDSDDAARLRTLPEVREELAHLCQHLGLPQTDIAEWPHATAV